MIPKFPRFQKLQLNHKNEIDRLTKKFPPYSDYNFVSLWTYNTKNDIIVSKLHNNLVVRFQDYLTAEPFYSFLGHHQIVKTATALIDYAKKNGVKPQLKLIPEIVIATDREIHAHFLVQEDHDNFDYISSLEEISELKGEKYNRKRRLIKKFHRQNPNHQVAVLDLQNKNTQSDVLQCFYIWERAKEKNKKDTQHELIVLQRLLKYSNQFNLVAIGIYHKKKLIGFSISEIVHNAYTMGHFMKGDILYKGIFETLYKYSSEHLIKKGGYYINLEQDMGLTGLKHSKKSWGPVHYLKKYKISPKK